MAAGDIDRIVAEGEVHFVRADQKARGDQAVYEAATDSVTFTGNVVLTNAKTCFAAIPWCCEMGKGRTTLRRPPSRASGSRGCSTRKTRTPPAQPAAELLTSFTKS